MNTTTNATQPTTRGLVAAGDVELWVDQRGDGPDVVLIAGLSDPAEAWTFQLDGLADRYRLTAFDNRGAGRSPMPPDGFDVRGMADDVAELMRSLGIEQAHVAGFSGGSTTAQELALRHPEVVRSLVLVSTWARADTFLRTLISSFSWLAEVAPSERAMMEAFFLWIYTARAHEDGTVAAIIDEALAFEHPQSPEGFARQLAAWSVHDTFDRLPQITVPTLVVAGGQDLCTPPRYGRIVADRIPGAELVVLPDEAHQTFQERPDEFNTLVDSFWARVDAGARRRSANQHLPQHDGRVFLTDGGLETTLIFDDGFDLPDFAAFVLLDDPSGRAALERYFDAYVAIAVRDRVGIVLETPTWRASMDWGARLGYDADAIDRVNRDAVAMLQAHRDRHRTASTPIVVSGCIGPRGDGYQIGQTMSVDEARAYHGLQARAFAGAGADVITAITMTYVEEAIGVVEAARGVGLPVVISFTVETDGLLPSGQSLGSAITAVDEATGGYAACFMVNCAHPTHFAHLFEGQPAWADRIGAIRANASTRSHAELDEAETLDRGDPADLAARYRALRDVLPNLRVLGGCCGTDHHHVDAISSACALLSR